MVILEIGKRSKTEKNNQKLNLLLIVLQMTGEHHLVKRFRYYVSVVISTISDPCSNPNLSTYSLWFQVKESSTT